MIYLLSRNTNNCNHNCHILIIMQKKISKRSCLSVTLFIFLSYNIRLYTRAIVIRAKFSEPRTYRESFAYSFPIKNSRNESPATKPRISHAAMETPECSKSQKKGSLKSCVSQASASASRAQPVDDSSAFSSRERNAHTTTCTGATRRIPALAKCISSLSIFSAAGRANPHVSQSRPGEPWAVRELREITMSAS